MRHDPRLVRALSYRVSCDGGRAWCRNWNPVVILVDGRALNDS
jgi:hypothetical protein